MTYHNQQPLSPEEELERIAAKWDADLNTPESQRTEEQKRALELREHCWEVSSCIEQHVVASVREQRLGSLATRHIGADGDLSYAEAMQAKKAEQELERTRETRRATKMLAEIHLRELNNLGIQAPQQYAGEGLPPEPQSWENPAYRPQELELDAPNASTLEIARHVARAWMGSIAIQPFIYHAGERKALPVQIDAEVLQDTEYVDEAIYATCYLLNVTRLFPDGFSSPAM
jgi:hypothetical protein